MKQEQILQIPGESLNISDEGIGVEFNKQTLITVKFKAGQEQLYQVIKGMQDEIASLKKEKNVSHAHFFFFKSIL